MWLASLAAAPKFDFGGILMPALLLVGGILLAALVLLFIKKWNQQAPGDDTAHDQLARFRDLYQHGEMSPEEYKRVHALLAGKIREESNVPQPQPLPKAPAAEPQPNGQPPDEGSAISG
jgi:hypothetical protein